MSIGLTLESLVGLVRVALAAIALVGVPTADAFICADEAPDHAVEFTLAANTAATPDSGTQDQHEPVDVHQCMHGHCHHAAPLGGFTSKALPAHDMGSDVFPHELAFSLQSVSTGLERPPKA